MGMGIFYYLAGQGDVLFKAVLGTVDHYRAESAVHTGLADVKVGTMVQMQGNGQIGVGNGCFHQLGQIDMLGILPGTGRYLQDQRGTLLSGCFSNTLDDLHIVDIERADGISAFIRFLEHFSCCTSGITTVSPLKGVWIVWLCRSGNFPAAGRAIRSKHP